MNVREKLADIIQNSVGGCARHWAEIIADGLIAHGVTVQDVPETNVGEWILVEDRLPEEDQIVLCLRRNGRFWVAQWTYIDWQWYDENEWHIEKEVTHWMPLPQPPKGE